LIIIKNKNLKGSLLKIKKKNLPVQFVQVPVEPVRVPSFEKLNIGLPALTPA